MALSVGIDYGTTYSTLCYDSSRSDGCILESGSAYIPTAVLIRRDGTFDIGSSAINDVVRGGNLYRDVKRWVGCNDKNLPLYVKKLRPSIKVVPSSSTSVLIGPVSGDRDAVVDVTVLIALFVKGMAVLCERATGRPVGRAVCSVPAEYNSFKRQFVFCACTALSIGTQAVVNEPTAAAFHAYERARTMGAEYILVYDFGGGTFDVSLAAINNKYLAVSASAGDETLGGRDVDRAITKYIKDTNGIPPEEFGEFGIEHVKVRASKGMSEHRITLASSTTPTTVHFSIDDLRKVCEPFVKRALNVVVALLRREKATHVAALLVGGSSTLPGIRESLLNLSQIVSVDIDVSTYRSAVAIGACKYAVSFSGTERIRLLDTLSHTVSREKRLFGSEPVMSKGHAIPTIVSTNLVMTDKDAYFTLKEGEYPYSFDNDITYSAMVRLSQFGNGTIKVIVKVHEDGRLEASVGNVLLENTQVPYTPKSSDVDLRYVSVLDNKINEGAEVYKSVARRALDETQENWDSKGYRADRYSKTLRYD